MTRPLRVLRHAVILEAQEGMGPESSEVVLRMVAMCADGLRREVTVSCPPDSEVSLSIMVVPAPDPPGYGV